ncbi:MAG TPA: hypothetical protein VN723_02210 [Rhizomicrobium sp.]|jgi:hypothetical protein|nr:hypothetical protein [Rhizomicrobium sp.]
MNWLSAVLADYHFWVGTAAGVACAGFLVWEQRRLNMLKQAREKDALLRKYLGY